MSAGGPFLTRIARIFSGNAFLEVQFSFPEKLTTFFGRCYRYVKHTHTERSNVKTAWKKLNIWQLIGGPLQWYNWHSG